MSKIWRFFLHLAKKLNARADAKHTINFKRPYLFSIGTCPEPGTHSIAQRDRQLGYRWGCPETVRYTCPPGYQTGTLILNCRDGTSWDGGWVTTQSIETLLVCSQGMRLFVLYTHKVTLIQCHIRGGLYFFS